MTLTSETKFEVRTKVKKTLTATFNEESLAMGWLQRWHLKDPTYAKSLALFKVTTHIEMEAV